MPEFIPTHLALYAAVAFIAFGFGGLVWSADRFVMGSAAIARSFGIAPIVIGLTIVSFGTSAPEVAVSIDASLRNQGALAVGNAIGSNLANIGLVLGVTLLIARMPVQKHILWNEMLVLMGISIAAGYFLYDGMLNFWEGILLLGSLVPLMYYLVTQQQKLILQGLEPETDESIPDIPRMKAFLWFLVGLVVLIVSSRILVTGAVTIADYFGVSPFVIGLTVIAIGTSLPELAASVTSALKGHHDIALGNIIGSNIFNLLAVMSLPGIISPPNIGQIVFTRDFMFMMLITLLLAIATFWVVKRTHKGTAALGRFTGFLLLCVYIAYYLVLGTSTH